MLGRLRLPTCGISASAASTVIVSRLLNSRVAGVRANIAAALYESDLRLLKTNSGSGCLMIACAMTELKESMEVSFPLIIKLSRIVVLLPFRHLHPLDAYIYIPP